MYLRSSRPIDYATVRGGVEAVARLGNEVFNDSCGIDDGGIDENEWVGVVA